ncbi:MAG: WD40/YVTN/BNR-like repeat-containing protein [Acidimicrobiales bacterium]
MAVATVLIAVACFVALPTAGAMGSSSGNVWNVATEPSPTTSWSAITYGDGQWVALGDGAVAADSPNGSTWTEDPVPAGSWKSVAYGNGRFVALSSANANPEELVSTDGLNWTAVAGPAGPWNALTFGGGRFVAVSSAGQIDTSTNGTQWRTVWHHGNLDFSSVAYGNGHFIATDSALGAIGLSTNGVNWSRLFPARNAVTDWGAVVYGEGEFVALSNSGDFATSVYGYVWTLHSLSPAEAIDSATFGCGTFVGVGQSATSTESFISSTPGTAWATTAVPIDATSNWTAVGYGAHRFVAVDTTGNIAWSKTTANCFAIIPLSPQQVSGNIHSGKVWTYMHPPSSAGGAPVNSYRVNISKGSFIRHCVAPVYYEPNCIIAGLQNHQVYTLTAQAHNRFGYSVPTDPEFVIPVASLNLSAVPSEPVVSPGGALELEVTGVRPNSLGFYPITTITVHVGATIVTCHPNPFGECIVTIPNPPIGSDSIYATYTGYGSSYRSPTTHVTVRP